MVDNRKQAVSIRLGHGDIRKVKRLADRLGVRDSDIIRFALKSALNRVAPLCDPQITGPSLVPMFVEAGAELIRHFELDAFRLEQIINEESEERRRVEHDDIALLAMSATQQPFLHPRLATVNGSAEDGRANFAAVRRYLYDKYVYRVDAARTEAEREADEDTDQDVRTLRFAEAGAR